MSEMFASAEAAIAWINGARYAGEKRGLENMKALLNALGEPQEGLRCLHVAGTNGKGSTCALLESALRQSGYKTGLYTSPYLMRFSERMRVNGAPITDEALVEIASIVREEAEKLVARGVKPTTFELGTAIALMYFAREKVDAAVIEVGLGGRLDPTNVITPELSLIASIGIDHVKLLGDTIEQIAFEKAGIIKPGVPVALARQAAGAAEVVRAVAEEKRAPLYDLAEMEMEIVSETARGARVRLDGEEAEIALAGRHQAHNACLALAGIRILNERGWRVDRWREGFMRARWPGRLEWLDDGLLLDGAHNPHGAAALADYARKWLSGRDTVLLIGMMRDKDAASCARIYSQIAARAVATRVNYPRALSVEALSDILEGNGIAAEADEDVFRALERARALAGPNGVVIVCGSLYLVGEVRLELRDDGGAL